MASQTISQDTLLKETSRSFYLTLRVLPRTLRPQIGLAYLLARTTDTIADTELIPLEQRIIALQKLRERILTVNHDLLDFGELARCQVLPAEKLLLERCEDALNSLERLNAADQQRVQTVLKVIMSGQELDLRRFAGASEKNIIALKSADELDDYTYRVAGCVGEFWTRMCLTHLYQRAKLDEATLMKQSVRFGKGLQLINILRDLPKDLRQGRCYLPSDELSAAGLAPNDLLDPANEPRLRAIYTKHLGEAQAHLAAGWEYTNALPWRSVRVRLACAWPILIGIQTIKKLRVNNPLDDARRIKISRADVRGIVLDSIIAYPFSGKWRRQFEGY